VPRFTPEALEANQPIVELVGEFAERKQATPVPIPGTRKIERVRENIKTAEVALTVAEVEEIDARSAHLTVIGNRGSPHEHYG
jgi:aryl-alcohol dehydrogenase-like predicted oxidoreductase